MKKNFLAVALCILTLGAAASTETDLVVKRDSTTAITSTQCRTSHTNVGNREVTTRTCTTRDSDGEVVSREKTVCNSESKSGASLKGFAGAGTKEESCTTEVTTYKK